MDPAPFISLGRARHAAGRNARDLPRTRGSVSLARATISSFLVAIATATQPCSRASSRPPILVPPRSSRPKSHVNERLMPRLMPPAAVRILLLGTILVGWVR